MTMGKRTQAAALEVRLLREGIIESPGQSTRPWRQHKPPALVLVGEGWGGGGQTRFSQWR